MVRKLFWDKDEYRLRSFWRLAVHSILFFILLMIFGTGAIFAGMSVLLLQGTMSVEEFFASVMDQSVISIPIILLFSALAMLAATGSSMWFVGTFIDRRRITSFGFRFNRNWWLDFIFGLGLGAGLMALIFLVELAAGWIRITDTFISPPGTPFGLAMFGALILFMSVGIYEELLSRGYHLKNMSEGFRFLGQWGSVVTAVLLSSAIFGIGHIMNPNASAISTFNIFLAGIFLALGAILTGELAIPIGIHITWNFFQGNVFGFPVSGSGTGITFIAIEQGGNPLLTGGPFGPEAGLIGIAAILSGCFFVIGWVRWRYGRLAITPHLTTPDLRPRRPSPSGVVQSEGVIG